MLTETDRRELDITGILADDARPHVLETIFYNYVWELLRNPINDVVIHELKIGPKCFIR